MTADVSYLSSEIGDLDGLVGDTRITLDTVSSDYLTSADKTELSNALTSLNDAKLAKTDFAALSNEIGLSAAKADNHVATKADIATLDGVMHFKGVVSAVPSSTEGYEVGDVVLVSGSSTAEDNGKEFVLVEIDRVKQWEQIGDQAHYATKSYVDTGDANTLTAANAYTDGKITDISGTITATYATKTELTSTAHDLSTDYNTKVEALSDAIDGIADNYATKTELNDVSVALSTDYVGKIKTVDDKVDGILSDYLKAADKTALETLVGTTSAETLVSANAYTDTKFAGLSDYYTKDEVDAISSALSTDYSGKIKAVDDKLADYALSVDVTSEIDAAKSKVIGEATDLSSAGTINGAKAYAKDYTDEAIAGLSVDNFIKHGEVIESDLSGFFILECGTSAPRTGEPTPPFSA